MMLAERLLRLVQSRRFLRLKRVQRKQGVFFELWLTTDGGRLLDQAADLELLVTRAEWMTP